MMQHYMETKKEYPDCILLFRLGDFYEMFYDDAVTASQALELVLTGKDCGGGERAPMCGVPYHAVESYISKLITKGYRVAVCEQLEDPAQSKGIVKRDVVRVVTPGTVTEGAFLAVADLLRAQRDHHRRLAGRGGAGVSEGPLRHADYAGGQVRVRLR